MRAALLGKRTRGQDDGYIPFSRPMPRSSLDTSVVIVCLIVLKILKGQRLAWLGGPKCLAKRAGEQMLF